MEANLRSVKKYYAMVALCFLSLLTSIPSLAQEGTTNENVNVDGNSTDTGFLSGSPWLWVLFIAVFILVIVVLTRGRRN